MIIQWLPAAQHDFDSIVDYIAADSPVAAIEQGDEIERQVAALREHHQLGRPGRIEGTRELVIVHTPYIVAYRLLEDKIQILRILHTARQWPERL